MNNRVINFGAGPAMLPDSVLQRAAVEMLNWRGTGMSAMEIGHRSPLFQNFLAEVNAKFRKLLAIPINYKILFLPGGGKGQFAAVPMNLLPLGASADYLDTGVWSNLAIEEAQQYGKINIVASGAESHYYSVPERKTWKLNPQAAYFYYCPNETIAGVQIHSIPQVDVPLVADLTSCLGSSSLDMSRFGVIFAGAQKNLGQAGVTVVIVRDDLLNQAQAITPSILDYTQQVNNHSCVNTPPTYAIYIFDLMLDWLAEQGGVSAIEKSNRYKAKMLYAYIDESNFYRNLVDPTYRSIMNISLTLPTEALTQQFLATATNHGFVGLKGHKKIGGIRVSLYNPITESMVVKLVEVMRSFAKTG